jgi:hypothetical protein
MAWPHWPLYLSPLASHFTFIAKCFGSDLNLDIFFSCYHLCPVPVLCSCLGILRQTSEPHIEKRWRENRYVSNLILFRLKSSAPLNWLRAFKKAPWRRWSCPFLSLSGRRALLNLQRFRLQGLVHARKEHMTRLSAWFCAHDTLAKQISHALWYIGKANFTCPILWNNRFFLRLHQVYTQCNYLRSFRHSAHFQKQHA